MKSFFPRLLALLVVPLLLCTLLACGDGHGKSKEQDRNPAFDVSGAWLANMDGVYLGKFHFKMNSKGSLSGDLVTDHNIKGVVSGAVSGYKAEFTITFSDAAYLASLNFQSDRSNATGSIVDNNGRIHPVTLYK